MLLKNLPPDINIELLLSYFERGSFKVNLKGLHKRNVYNDISDIEEKADGTLLVSVARNSIYNALPEYLFHPIDRFSNLPILEEKERFAEEYEKQEQEKKHAYRFFAPMDILLLMLKIETREQLREYVDTNKVLTNIILDDEHQLSDEQTGNRFIRKTVPFLVYSKYIRGNKTLLTFLLRKIFMDEGLEFEIHDRETEYEDFIPRYSEGLNGQLNDSFLGNMYYEPVKTYNLHYWPEKCDENFLQLVQEVDLFRRFVEDYFLSVEESLQFNITDSTSTVTLSDDVDLNYLNYNTNI